MVHVPRKESERCLIRGSHHSSFLGNKNLFSRGPRYSFLKYFGDNTTPRIKRIIPAPDRSQEHINGHAGVSRESSRRPLGYAPPQIRLPIVLIWHFLVSASCPTSRRPPPPSTTKKPGLYADSGAISGHKLRLEQTYPGASKKDSPI